MAEYTKDADTTKNYVISADIEISDSCLFRFGWEQNNTYQQVQKGKFRAKCNANTITQSFVCYTRNAEVTIKVTNLMVGLSEDSTFEEFTDGPSPNPNYPQEIETVGNNINILPGKEYWEQGSVDNKTGEPFSSTTRIRNKGFIGVEPKTNYFASIQNDDYAFVNIILYDNKGTYIKDYYSINNAIKGAKALLITIPENCYNIKVILKNADDTSNITVDEYPQIKAKFEKGDIQTPYSVYGQGSVEVIKQNKNFLYYEAQNQSTNGINFTVNSDKSIQISGTATAVVDFYLIGSATNYESINLQGAYKINGCNSGSTSKYMLYVVKKSKYGTLTYYQNVSKDNEINIDEGDTLRIFIRVLSGVTVSDTIYPMLRLSTETDDTYVEAKKESYIMPIQQEMLEGDYIDSTEHHEWGKTVLDGTESWAINRNADNLIYFYCGYSKVKPNTVAISNMLRNKDIWTSHTNQDLVKISVRYTTINIMLSDTTIDTVDGLKAFLKSKYDEGNPVIIYYKLATPIELELTDAQKAISKYLQPYDNGTTILVTDKLATITASYTKKGENDEN